MKRNECIKVFVVMWKHHVLWSDTACVQMQNQYAPNIYRKIKNTRMLHGSVIKPTSTDKKE